MLPFQSSQIVVAPCCDHVAPARVVGLRGDGVGEVGAAVVGEDLVEVLAADQAGADVALRFVLDLVDQVGEDAFCFVRRAPGRSAAAGRRRFACRCRTGRVRALKNFSLKASSSSCGLLGEVARRRPSCRACWRSAPSAAGRSRGTTWRAAPCRSCGPGSCEWMNVGSSGGTHQSP